MKHFSALFVVQSQATIFNFYMFPALLENILVFKGFISSVPMKFLAEILWLYNRKKI